jgi:hypothetical protein
VQALFSKFGSINTHARDVVDESDEKFSVRFELIYTMGTQRPIELSPDRWILLQQVLDLVKSLAIEIATNCINIIAHIVNVVDAQGVRNWRAPSGNDNGYYASHTLLLHTRYVLV